MSENHGTPRIESDVDQTLVLDGVEVTISASAMSSKEVLEAIRNFTASFEESARCYDENGVHIIAFNLDESDLWRDEISQSSELPKRHGRVLEELQNAAGEDLPEDLQVALLLSCDGKRYTFAPFSEKQN